MLARLRTFLRGKIVYIKFISSPVGSFDRYYSLYEERGGRRLVDITIAVARCCAMNVISNFPCLNENDWKEVKRFLSNENAFRYKEYGGSLEVGYSAWRTKTFFLTMPSEEGAYNPPIYSLLRKDPDLKLVHSFTNHAHGGHKVCLYKLEFK